MVINTGVKAIYACNGEVLCVDCCVLVTTSVAFGTNI